MNIVIIPGPGLHIEIPVVRVSLQAATTSPSPRKALQAPREGETKDGIIHRSRWPMASRPVCMGYCSWLAWGVHFLNCHGSRVPQTFLLFYIPFENARIRETTCMEIFLRIVIFVCLNCDIFLYCRKLFVSNIVMIVLQMITISVEWSMLR